MSIITTSQYWIAADTIGIADGVLIDPEASDRRDLRREAAFLPGGSGTLVGGSGERVELVAGQLLLGDQFGADALRDDAVKPQFARKQPRQR